MRSVLAMLLCFCGWALAALSEASWSGVLRDSSGTAVAGVTIILTDISGKVTLKATTKAGGEFAFSAIAPLIYNLSVVAQENTYKAEQPVFVNEGNTLTKNLAVIEACNQSRAGAGTKR